MNDPVRGDPTSLATPVGDSHMAIILLDEGLNVRETSPSRGSSRGPVTIVEDW